MNSMNTNPNMQSSTGLDQNIAGLLCYLIGPITAIIFLILEKSNRFVKFHAMQSLITFGGLFVINIVLNIIPFLGAIISFILTPIAIILWILLMVFAYQGKWFKLPVIGEMAEKQIHNFR